MSPASAKQRARSMVRKAARRGATHLPDVVQGQATALRAARWRTRLVAELLTKRAFDREWYEAQSATTFASDAAACEHYLDEGRRAGLSPHPLFEPSLAVPNGWQTTEVDPLVAAVRGRASDTGVTHPALPVGWDRASPHGGRPRWLEWVASAGPDSLMPPLDDGDDVPLTWAEFRARALEQARELAALRGVRDVPRATQVEPQLTDLARLPPAPSETGRPLVSIVMPTWNRAALVPDAIASVRAQTLDDWELLVVDDGSDDGTLELVQELARGDERIRVFAESHVGVCHARNVGIAHARGRFLAFLDSDNTWTPGFLAAMTASMAESSAPWAHAVMKLIRNDGTYYRAFEGDLEHLLNGNYIDLNVLVADRAAIERIGGFDESLRRAVDYDLVLRLSDVAPPRLVPFVGAVYADDKEDASRISVAEPYRWSTLVRLRHWMRRVREVERATMPGRVSIVVPARQRPSEVSRRVDALRSAADDVEIIVVAADADAHVERILRVARARRRNTTHLLSLPISELSGALTYGAAHATGEYLVAWSPNCVPDGDWCGPLVDALAAPQVAAAQPLQLRGNGLIDSAGGVFADTDVCPTGLLAGLPVEDAASLGTTVVPTLRADVVAARTETVRALDGFDLWFASALGESDLGLRARSAGLGEPVVVPESRVVAGDLTQRGFFVNLDASVALLRARHTAVPGSSELWNRLGFDVVGMRTFALASDLPASTAFGVEPVVRPRLTSVVEGVPMLRWAIDTAAPAGEAARLWGDVYFGRSLADALRRLGQQVHVDNREQRGGAYRDLDDVTLVLRGLRRPGYRPGGIRMMWVISHPDLVSEAECAEYSRVFAASNTWSAERTGRWATRVEPLLQCTDAQLFTPDAAEPDSGQWDIVFVGNSRAVTRPSLLHTIAAGQAPAVFGGGWDGVIDERYIAAPFIANTALPALYAASGVVLNDHWSDMKDEGFISNRVFDVLACGGRLLTDDAAGLEELFGDAVRVFRSDADVARALEGEHWRQRFPDREQRLATAQTVRTEHSFDNRARVLLDAALEIHAAR